MMDKDAMRARSDAERARRLLTDDTLYPEYPAFDEWEKDAIREHGWIVRTNPLNPVVEQQLLDTLPRVWRALTTDDDTDV